MNEPAPIESSPEAPRPKQLAVALGVSGLLHVGILVLRLPGRLPDWAWPVSDPAKPAGSAWVLAGMAGLVALAAWLAIGRRIGAPIAVVSAWALAVGLQYGLALTEGRGLLALRERMIDSGHAEFADVAVSPGLDGWAVATHYEELIDQGRLGVYARSKPPGQLLLYIATERVAQWLTPRTSEPGRLKALRLLACATWPLFAGLTVLPLYMYARLIAGAPAARSAALWYAVVPAVLLITLHTDQAFFPGLGVAFAALITAALRRGRALPLVLAGSSFAVLLWFTFGFLGLAVFAIVLTVGTQTPEGARPSAAAVLRRAALLAAGGILGLALLRLGLHYDAWNRYRKALAFHSAWGQHVHWDLPHSIYFGSLNILEYAIWLGFPLAVLLALAALRGARDVARGDRSDLAVHGAAFLATIVSLALFGKTAGETARLWLFLTPIALPIAAGWLWRRAEPLAPRITVLVVVLQTLIAYATKLYMDFG